MRGTKPVVTLAKKWLLVVLVLVLALAMVPAVAFAGDDNTIVESSEQAIVDGAVATSTGVDAASATQGETSDDPVEDDENAGVDGEQTTAVDADNQESLVEEAEEAEGAVTPDEEAPAEEEMSALGEVSPYAAADSFSGIDTVITPTSFPTFDNRAAGTAPPQLTITLQLQPTASYTDGGVIELPLDYNPAAQGLSTFTYGTDGTDGVGNIDGNPTPDFFELDTTALEADIAESTSLVESYTIENGVLKLNLKSVSEYTAGSIVGLKSFQLFFNFNDDYKMKVPTGTVMWKPEPRVCVDDELARTAVQREVKTSAVGSIGPINQRFTPNDQYYLGGAMTVRVQFWNYSYYHSDFDPSYESKVWIEVPTGTTTTTAFITAFPDGFVEDINNSGYDRYYRVVTNIQEDWGQLPNPVDPNAVFRQNDISFTPPESIADGAAFEVRTGAEWRKVNGEAKQASTAFNYIKQDRAIWDIYLNAFHGQAGSVAAICGIEDGAVVQSGGATYGPYVSYVHTGTPKNEGSGPITGVRYELFQASTDSSKVNYNTVSFTTVRDTGNPDDIPAWTRYRYSFIVKDADTGTSSEVAGGTITPSAAGNTQPFSLTLPALNTNQYIDKVVVVPLGTDGSSEGVLSSRNGFGMSQTAKSWPNRTWPDGTEVPGTQTRVPLRWSISYDDNPNKPAAYPAEGGTPTTYYGNTAYVSYTNQPYAQANLVSATAPAGVTMGAVVDYVLNGYNNSNYTVGSWNNPRVIVRVPKVLELVDPNSVKELTDVATGDTYDANAVLTGSDANYNYYSFTALNYSAPERTGQQPVFTIPLQFKVSDSALIGDYAAPRVVVTSATPSSFYGSYNLPLNGNLTQAASLYGLSAGDNYSIVASPASSALKVISTPRLDVTSAVSSEATNGLDVSTELVPARHGETVHMKVTIRNSGNVGFTTIRLYDILPYNGDNLGSTGAITFNSLSLVGATDPTISYTNSSDVPVYGEHGAEVAGAGGTADLQVSTFQNSWAVGSPPADTTATFIDFGSQELAAGQSIDIIFNFDIPATGAQTAYNQIRYSAQEVDSSTLPLNQNAPKQGFSTETIGIIYHSDLPALYAPGGTLEGQDDLAGIPEAQSAFFLGLGNDVLTVNADEPSLSGFTFEGWADEQGSSDVVYDAGEDVIFTAPGTVNLYPVWSLSSYTVSYTQTNAPAGAPALPATTTQAFNASVDVAAVPVLAGYTFVGWTPTSAGVNVIDGSFTMPANNVAFTGTWTANSNTLYTIEHHRVDSSGELVATDQEQRRGTTDTTVTLGAADARTYTGYTFDSTYVGTELQGTIAGDGSLVLHLYYTINTYTVTFVNWDATVLSIEAGIEYGSSATAPTNPVRSAYYEFSGWDTDFSSVTENLTVTALYDALPTYTVQYLPGVYGTFAAQTTDLLLFGQATPAAPTITGQADWLFTGWTPVPTGTVTGNAIYVAQWAAAPVGVFTVTFVDWNGVLLQSGDVTPGADATAPAAPVRAGYTFTGWDVDFTNVQGNLTVTAQYVADPVTILETDVPLADSPTVDIFGTDVPLFGTSGLATWSLFDLICTALALVFMVISILRYAFVRTREEDEDEIQRQAFYGQGATHYEYAAKTKHRRSSMLIASVVISILAVVLFFITQDLTRYMVLFDVWSIVFGICVVVALVALILVVYKKEEKVDPYTSDSRQLV